MYIYIGLLYTKAKCSITKIVSDVSFLPIFVPVALAPPCLFRAHTHSFQYETLGLHHVEEQLANQVRRSGTDRFQTRPKPAVTRAVHERVQPPIEQTVFTLQSANPHWARRVVDSTAPIRSTKPVELSVRFR